MIDVIPRAVAESMYRLMRQHGPCDFAQGDSNSVQGNSDFAPLPCMALVTASWAGSHVCREEGAGRDCKTPTKPVSLKQEVTLLLRYPSSSFRTERDSASSVGRLKSSGSVERPPSIGLLSSVPVPHPAYPQGVDGSKPGRTSSCLQAGGVDSWHKRSWLMQQLFVENPDE